MEAAGQPAGGPVLVHAARRSAMEKEPRLWRLSDDSLHVEQAGYSFDIPLAKLVALRLGYAPGRHVGNRYVAQVTTNTGVRFEICNLHWAGISDFEDRSASYRPLVRALHARLRVHSPQARLVTGASLAMWLASFAVLPLIAAVFWMFAVIGGPVLVAVQLALIALSIPTVIRYLRVNRPRRLPIGAEAPPGVIPA